MVYYEVSLTVQPDVADAYGAWLDGHVDEMLALPGFVSAEWLELIEDESDGATRWVIRYALESEAALRRYFDEFAETMRGDGLARFDGRFTAERRVMRPYAQGDKSA